MLTPTPIITKRVQIKLKKYATDTDHFSRRQTISSITWSHNHFDQETLHEFKWMTIVCRGDQGCSLCVPLGKHMVIYWYTILHPQPSVVTIQVCSSAWGHLNMTWYQPIKHSLSIDNLLWIITYWWMITGYHIWFTGRHAFVTSNNPYEHCNGNIFEIFHEMSLQTNIYIWWRHQMETFST